PFRRDAVEAERQLLCVRAKVGRDLVHGAELWMDARAENRDGARCRNDRARRRIDRSISLIRESEFRNGIEIDLGQAGLGDTSRITGVEGKRITIPEAPIESERCAPSARCLEIRVEYGDIAALVGKECSTAIACG